MSMTVEQAAAHVQGEVVGDGAIPLSGIASADKAKVGDLTFAENEAFFQAAEQSEASAILVSCPVVSSNKVLIRVTSARSAMARLLPLFLPPETFEPGIDPAASSRKSTRLNSSHT